MTQGAPPHPYPWPDDPRYDETLLAQGDSRNVDDRYRYWTVDAIRDDMAARSGSLEIAIENLARGFNMGTIVRNANAFNVWGTHIIGRRQWNKRAARKSVAEMGLEYQPSVSEFVAATQHRVLVAVDNTSGAVPLHRVKLPEQSVLIFGAEQTGISVELMSHCDLLVEIPQLGSTRSINVGVASGILLYKWVEQHILK